MTIIITQGMLYYGTILASEHEQVLYRTGSIASSNAIDLPSSKESADLLAVSCFLEHVVQHHQPQLCTVIILTG